MTNFTPTFDANPFEGMLDNLYDSRDQDLIRYSLPEILFVVLISSLCGCNKLTLMIVFANEKLDWFRKYYPYKYGIPSHDTLNRVLGMIDKKEFEKLFISWACSHFKVSANALLHIDGKRLNGSADKLAQSKKRNEGGAYAEIIVNVYASAEGIVVGHNDVSDKRDEIKGASQLLDWLEVNGCCITGDANFCRKNLVEKMVSKGADYLLALKAHLPTILNATKTCFKEKLTETESFQTEETGHGRYEKRTYKVLTAESLPEIATTYFKKLATITEVHRIRLVKRTGKRSEETHYYVSSLDEPVEQLADKIRKHWSIENNLHHRLDVSFGEDASRVRTKNAASNLSLVRKVSVNLLAKDSSKGALKHKQMRLALSDEKRDNLLHKIMMR